MRAEKTGILKLWGLHELAIYHKVEILVGLMFNRFYHFRMTVAGITNTDSPYQVNIFFSGCIPNTTSFCFHYFKCNG